MNRSFLARHLHGIVAQPSRTALSTNTVSHGPKRATESFLRPLILILINFVLLAAPSLISAQTRRLVVVKCDGLPYDLVDQFVKQRDPRTGKSSLPWIEHIFYQGGSRASNF